MVSSDIKELEVLEEAIERQRKLVEDLTNESIQLGYSPKGDEKEQEKMIQQKNLEKMEYEYQVRLNRASQILRNL